MSAPEHRRRGDREVRFGRRELLGGLIAAAGVGAVAALLDEGASSGSTRLLSARPLEARASAFVKKGSTTYSYVSRPDLHPPRVLLDVNRPGQDGGLVVTDSHGRGQQGPMLIGRDGEIVWFYAVSDNGTPKQRAFNTRVQRYKGEPVLSYFVGAVTDGHGEGYYRILDTSYREVATVQGHNGLKGDLHDFLITPQDTALFTSYGTAVADLRAVGGSRQGKYFFGEVQEVEIESGKLLFYWRSDAHVGFEASYAELPKSGPWDYFHLNSIAVDPTDGNLIISSRMCWAFYKVDRTTGQVIWQLGGKKGDFELGPGAEFAWQHDVTPQPNGLYTIFDNEGALRVKRSRGLVLRVDEAARRATLVRQYLHHPPLFSVVLGSVQDLPRAHRFIGWGTTTYFTEYDEKGEVLLDGHLDGAGLESYRAFKSPWAGLPDYPPAVVARREGARTVAYVSWNGAATVAHWVVRGGPTPRELRVLGRAPKRGFETAIDLPGRPSFVEVQALNGSGHPLRRSGSVRVR